jgi:hypothetical protein
MNTFNRNRYHIVVENYLIKNDLQILSPMIVNKMEPVLVTVRRNCKIKFGNSFKSIKKL